MFPCEEWFSKSTQLSREISASVLGQSVLRQTSFHITVKTSDKAGAGTNANVSIELFGEYPYRSNPINRSREFLKWNKVLDLTLFYYLRLISKCSYANDIHTCLKIKYVAMILAILHV